MTFLIQLKKKKIKNSYESVVTNKYKNLYIYFKYTDDFIN